MAFVGRFGDTTSQGATVLVPLQFVTMDQGQFMAVQGAITGSYTTTPFVDTFVTDLSTLTLLQGLGVVKVNESMTAIFSDSVVQGSTLTDTAS